MQADVLFLDAVVSHFTPTADSVRGFEMSQIWFMEQEQESPSRRRDSWATRDCNNWRNTWQISHSAHALVINHSERHSSCFSLYVPPSAFAQGHRGLSGEGHSICQLLWRLVSRREEEFRLVTHLFEPLWLQLLYLLSSGISCHLFKHREAFHSHISWLYTLRQSSLSTSHIRLWSTDLLAWKRHRLKIKCYFCIKNTH